MITADTRAGKKVDRLLGTILVMFACTKYPTIFQLLARVTYIKLKAWMCVLGQ